MHSYEEWFAARPPTTQLHRRIDALKAELALLEAVVALPDSTTNGSDRPNGQTTQPKMLLLTPDASPLKDRVNGHRPLTEERASIVRAMLRNSDHVGSPSAVGIVLRSQGIDIEDSAIQTTMSRMERAGQLSKVRRGLYFVPDNIATLVRETELAGVTEG